jgi:hypothetical protein
MLDGEAQKTRLDKVIELAGKRYDTAVNLKVKSVLEYMHAQNREEPFLTELLGHAYAIKKNLIPEYIIESNPDKKDELESINEKTAELVSTILKLKNKPRDQQVRWSLIKAKITQINKESYSLHDHFEDSERPNVKKDDKNREITTTGNRVL